MVRKASTARSDLEHMLVDETAEPKALPLALLQDITGGFSDGQEIGRGGFAVVYKGIIGDVAVAVKRFSNPFMEEKDFVREVKFLMQVKHKNIVRFLGYCADRQGIMDKYDGNLLMADVHQRLLVFEYIPGSVHKFISDPRHDWEMSYKIIKGICEGLHCLHENQIIHLDLKPSNILLDNNMVPEIIDFGVSVCFDEIQSHHITKSTPGTIGYLAPEFIERGEIGLSNDLYSLGVVIWEILTGQKGDIAIEDVLESWSGRLATSQQETLCDQIRVCYEITLECRDYIPSKRPTSARDIIDRLHQREIIQAASSTSGVAATESKRKSNTDGPRVSHFTPTPGRGAHPLEGQTVVMPRPSAGPWEPSEMYSSSLRSKVYYSPKLVYLKVSVLAAHDLVPSEKGRPLSATTVKIQMGNQIRHTRPQGGTANPAWNEEFMFVACEPFEDPLVVTVEECLADQRKELVGRVIIPVAPPYVTQNDLAMSVRSKWFSLWCGMKVDETANKIQLKMSLETAYHVLDESRYNLSDLQPAAKKLRKNPIGILEVGILGAHGLGGNRNPYCVAKYGTKWVSTRTLLATTELKWNEQYTWEVFDLSTVITIAVFDNANLHHGHDDGASEDQRIGKVRIRVGRLESGRVYTNYYPLMALSPSGLTKTGELQLAVRFTCTAWASMLAQYGRPLLPRVHYRKPISVQQLDYLRSHAIHIVATRLGRAEPPLRREVVEYVLDADSHTFSLRRGRANIYRITSLLSGVLALGRWFDDICKWKKPLNTTLVHVLFLFLVCRPELILPTVFLCMMMIWAWNYRRRPRMPPQIDTVLSQGELAHRDDTVPPRTELGMVLLYADQAHPDDLDEELDTFPTSKPDDVVRMRYDRLRKIVGTLQTVLGDLATQAERAQSLLRWHEPRATPVFIMLSLVVAVVLYLTPFQLVAMVVGLYVLRPPWLRSRTNMLFNLYTRLPSSDDVIL